VDALPVVDFPEIHLVFVNQAPQVFAVDHLTTVDPVLLGVPVVARVPIMSSLWDPMYSKTSLSVLDNMNKDTH